MINHLSKQSQNNFMENQLTISDLKTSIDKICSLCNQYKNSDFYTSKAICNQFASLLAKQLWQLLMADTHNTLLTKTLKEKYIDLGFEGILKSPTNSSSLRVS